jgi:16S rRNA (cytidine1402-2'-O)-methyltransferase
LPEALAVLASEMPDRPAAVCRELTKRFEEVVPGTLEELAGRFREPPPGEITIVLGPWVIESSGVPQEALAAVAELVAAGVTRRQAVDLVARLSQTPKNALYRASL